MATVTIDGKEYKIDDLSNDAKSKVKLIQAADRELSLVQQRVNMAQTARNVAVQELGKHLPEKKAAANKKKDVITIDDVKYNFADFSDDGKRLLQMVSIADSKLAQLQGDNAIARSARAVYAQSLKSELA